MAATPTFVTPSHRRRLPAIAGPLACGACLMAGAGYVAAVDPSNGGVFLPCPFRAVTGWWCPGCGLTRATHHLLRGDITGALHFNLLVVLILAAIAGSWFAWLQAARGRPVDWGRRIPAWVYPIAIVVVVAFAVVRNLPGVDGLRG